MELPINYTTAHWSVRKQAREQYIKKQDGKCYHCKKDLNDEPDMVVRKSPINPRLFPKGFFDHPIHLHHNHNTQMTIGAVHARCNAYMWQYLGE